MISWAEHLNQKRVETPAYVMIEPVARRRLETILAVTQPQDVRLLFSLKASSWCELLTLIAPKIDGFAASSLFEAKLARDLVKANSTVHLTTPGMRASEAAEIAEICDYVSCNSLSQWNCFRDILAPSAKCGLRVNPQLSFVKDDRYDPCRQYSKLGVELDQLDNICRTKMSSLEGISGLHIHTNCDAEDFSELRRTVFKLDKHLSTFLRQLSWINLGGGYIFDEETDLDPFAESIHLIKNKYGLQVYIEPGASVVRDSVFLISSVLDIVSSGGKRVAVLDSTVNHMPEVFEYQFAPDIEGATHNGAYEYVIAGCTCLAGDVFGSYSFDRPLEIGSRLIFPDAGAYTMVKAHMFNGVNLPSLYSLKETGELMLVRNFTYDDFYSRCGANSSVTL